jgi:hypothetical protein
MLRRAFDPNWNVFLNPRFTPPWLTAFAILGWIVLIRRDRWTGLGLLSIGVALMAVYTLMDSTLRTTGEMRYHLSALPVVLIGAGAGASVICQRLEQVQRRNWRPAWLIMGIMAMNILVYAPLIQYAEHPFQQELESAYLLRPIIAEKDTIILLPDRDQRVMDIYPQTITPALLGTSMRSRLWSYRQIPEAMKVAREGQRVLVYRGLYGFYASSTTPEDRWFNSIMKDHGVALGASKGPHLLLLHEEQRPFVPNHTILDRGHTENQFTVALYELVPGK